MMLSGGRVIAFLFWQDRGHGYLGGLGSTAVMLLGGIETEHFLVSVSAESLAT
jgi:hypothetical protein